MSPPPRPLSDEDRRTLLELARQAIQTSVCQEQVPAAALLRGALAERSGAFVTLHVGGRLRGCIGQVSPQTPLAETVVHCAMLAASADERFPPVTPAEVPQLEIEISVLSEPVPAKPEEVEIGRHGILVIQGGRRGVLLPQVAGERGWDRQRFVQETCRKAGLPADAWADPSVQLYVFTAEVFSEVALHGQQTS